MIDAAALLADCKRLVGALEADLRERIDEDGALRAALVQEHATARDAGRTRRSVEEWERERITQAAVAWVLGCVFVRFLEDSGLVETSRLSGPGERLRQAREQQTEYFREQPSHTAREYLVQTFRAIAVLPGCAGLYDERTNPLFSLPISGDAARELVEAWRTIDPNSGQLVHDFTDPAWSTRFLGDLYQDLSDEAKKQYALLQTPEFVEEFILERTLEPAIDEFGLAEVRLIDPACGSGHFLLGAFARLLDHWRRREPGTNVRALVERSLSALSGVDLNPFAAEIARFRLLVAAIHECNVARLRDAPDLRPDIAVGDSLLHGSRPGQLFGDASVASAPTRHLYSTEDAGAISRILNHRYHVVVANPPYITPKDQALNRAYRGRFSACSGKYALTVPFMQLLFDLALPPEKGRGAGYVGQITSNSFMKREFGKKLIEEHLTKLDLTLIIDTSGAYIPGHGTPTAVIVGRNRPPLIPTVRTVMGIQGEPSTPADPSEGLVWMAIVRQVDQPGSESRYVSVEDIPRTRYKKHPWSIAGGGASDLREILEARSRRTIASVIKEFGFVAITGEDEPFIRSRRADLIRAGVDDASIRPYITGDLVRDWKHSSAYCVFPYDDQLDPSLTAAVLKHLWPMRTLLRSGLYFGKTRDERELKWWEFTIVLKNKIRTSRSLIWCDVGTHQHYVYDEGSPICKETAPVLKFNPETTEAEIFELAAILNSSTACFWLKQVCHNKGSTIDTRGARQRTAPFEDFFQFTGAKVAQFPLPDGGPASLARRLHELAEELGSALPEMVAPTEQALRAARAQAESLREAMISLQEELDWAVYSLYGLIDGEWTCSDPPPLRLGERAFEIVLARRLAAGEEQSTWFERHGSTAITELPSSWPEDYRTLVLRRIALIESHREVGLIERPEYKRRWQWESWERQQEHALRSWLLDRLEDPRYWSGEPQLTSCARLTDEVRKDNEFRSVAELYTGRQDVDLAKLVEGLVIDEAVPYLAAWRYSDIGMRTRAAWERTWTLQRQEDAIDALSELADDDPRNLTPEQAKARKQVEVGAIEVPPRYTSKDFRKTSYWALRGKLDVPKERFILYPGCERAADTSPVIGWSGWNQFEQARALAQYLTRLRQEDRWDVGELVPLLAGLEELLPWVLQWHNEYDPAIGRRIGDAYTDFLRGQLAELGLTEDDLQDWRPPAATRGRRRREIVS